MDARGLDQAYRRDRRRLIERLQEAGIDDLAVLHALDIVPRHHFVPNALVHRAYEDSALPIGHGQTISRPAVHALHLCLAHLEGTERVLEVGTGSGYLTALLSVLSAHVYSVETVPELHREARRRLDALGASNVTLRIGDGSMGWPEHAPYDVILVGAAAPSVPTALLDQLSDRGRAILPVGDDSAQRLLRIRHTDDGVAEEVVEEARFVPLLGQQGW